MPVDSNKGDRNYTLQKAVDFTKTNQAWQIPYKNNVSHDHFKTKIENITERGMYCRLIETDAEFIKNVIDDILKDRKRTAEAATNNVGDSFTRYFREEDYNGYLNEPVFRSHMRFMAWSVNHLDDALKEHWIIKPYVYVRTHVKNPYVYQNLISLNSDNLYDSTINSIRPTLPALFITEAGELCYLDMFLAKARKKLPTPNEMMGYYSLLDLEGNVVIPEEVICNYSFRKQNLSTIFDTTYFFIHTKENKKHCLVTNSNLIPLYNIDFSTREIEEGASTITVTPKITGGGQQTRPDYWYDPYLKDEVHYFGNYSYYGSIGYVGGLYPEFNEDATSYNYDYLEFLKERRIYDLQKDATNTGEYIKSIVNTDKMEDTQITTCPETGTGASLENILEYKYPKLNKIYYYDGQRAFKYDPASQEDEALLQIASICGLEPVESLLDLSAYVLYSTNTSFLTSYETYANLYGNEKVENGPVWFFWGVDATTDAGPWSESYPIGETLLLRRLQVLSTSSANDVISQSKEYDEDSGGAILTDDIMTIRVTMETQQLQYYVKKGIFAEKNVDGDMQYVKYDVELIVEPKIGTFTGYGTVCARFKIKRYTGINFDNLVSSETIELINWSTDGKTNITKYENTKTHFRFLYYLDSYTEVDEDEEELTYTNRFRTYSENVKIYSRIKENITIKKTIAVGTIYDRDEWDYPGYTWNYDVSEKTFNAVAIKKNFDYLKPLYYYINTLTDLTSTYNQSNIVAQSTLNKLLGTSKAFVNSFTNFGIPYEKQYGFNEIIVTGGALTTNSKVFSHGILNTDKSFYTFKQQPCYNKKVPLDNPYPPTEANLYEDEPSEETLAYPRLKGSIHSSTKLFDVEQEESDLIDANDKNKKVIPHKKLITTNWDFSLEPPKSLIHPIPTQFTIIGPHYNSPVQAAAYKQYINEIGSEGDGYPYYYYGDTTTLYTENHMMIYYIPSDPILNEDDVTNIGSEKSLNFHFKGVNRDLGLSNKERFKVLTENSNFNGSLTLVGDKEDDIFPTSRKLKFSTKSNLGTFRLKIKDDLEIIKNPKTKETVLRVDQSPLIKIWPRTLPIIYQMDTDGVFQKVSNWKLGFLPAPKSNYHLRFFRKEKSSEQINLDEPFDPQYSIMRIKKVESSKTGDNDLEELSMEVSFWNIAYNGSPYIPKTLSKNSETIVEFNGAGSYPYYWYVVNTNKTHNVAVLLPYAKNGVVDKKKQKLITLNETGKFRLCVTDGSVIFYTSPEIEIK